MNKYLLTLLCGVWSITSSAAGLETITIGTVGVGSSTEWPVYIAIAKNFMSAQQINVDFISTQSSASVTQQVAAGSINMGTSGLADPLRAADQGAPVRILRIGMQKSPYEVYASPKIKKWEDLKKNIVMIGGIKDITRIYFEEMGKKNNLQPSSYDYLFAGATAARFAALASGSVAATILTPPFNFKAASQGFTYLGTSSDYSNNFPFTGYPINLNWARANKTTVQHFLKAFSMAVDWFYDVKNRDEAITILAQALKSDPQDAAKSYDFFVKIRIFDRDGLVDASGLENLIAILKQQGDVKGGVELNRFYDSSLIK